MHTLTEQIKPDPRRVAYATGWFAAFDHGTVSDLARLVGQYRSEADRAAMLDGWTHGREARARLVAA